MLLSIISPFYNSEQKCERLLRTLETLDAPDVELIFVDDGSTDGTLNVLSEFKGKAKLPTLIIPQSNKGPGGARNSGLKTAKGEYVWFVDSDDDINPEAINVLRDRHSSGFDFIDFDIVSKGKQSNSMGCSSAEYTEKNEVKKILLENFGRIWSKMIRRKLLLENGILYPEMCIYEDNPMVFLYPFYVKSFMKADVVGYYHHEEHESVTRSGISPRFFDRMYTAEHGLKYGLQLCANEKERDILRAKFTRLYFVNTARQFVDRVPSKNWLVAGKIAKQYRKLMKLYELESVSFRNIGGSLNFRIRFLATWVLSYFTPSDPEFFEAQRIAAWGREFYWERTEPTQ